MKLLPQLLEALSRKKVLEFQTLLLENEYIHDLDVTLSQFVNDRGAEDVDEVFIHVTDLGPGEFIDCKLVYSEKEGFFYVEDGTGKISHSMGHDPAEALHYCMPWLISVKLRNELEKLPEVDKIDILIDDNELDMSVIPKEHKAKIISVNKFGDREEDGNLLAHLTFTWKPNKQAFQLTIVGNIHTLDSSPSDPAMSKLFKSVDSVVEFVSKRLDESAKYQLSTKALV